MFTSMKAIKFCVYKEPPYYVAQCLNVDVSSFGETVEESIANLKEAVELYFEDAAPTEYHQIDEVLVGESVVNG
jgi:predicted RNase H-like HicB family nuclease